MRISEVAQIVGTTSKEVIDEVEALREELTAAGHKVAKRLTASSGLDEDSVKTLLATMDKRRKEAREAEAKAQQARAAEEASERRRQEEERRRKEEEERKRDAEQARRKADEELAKRQERLARLGIAKPAAAPAPSPSPSPSPAAPTAPPTSPSPAPGSASAPASAPRLGPAPAARSGQPPRPPAPKAPQEKPAPRPADRPAARQKDGRPAPQKPEAPGSQASTDQIQDFISQGIQAKVSETPRRARGKDDRPKTDERDAPRRRRGAAKAPTDGAKKFRPSQIFNNDLARRRGPGGRPSGGKRSDRRGSGQRGPSRPKEPKVVTLSGDFTVGQFADRTGIPTSDVIKQLMLMGEMKTMNQVLEPDLAELIAAELNVIIDVQPESDESDVDQFLNRESKEEDLKPRPPVVTVMGHVDHGKTTLLDTIRKANVVKGEAGGITQHIGSYYVKTDKGDVVFLDTPGHEAFTEMRARGADCTDIVVLVVAANDGVKPQTIEAINHAKAANRPIVVAINKMDVEGANPSRVKQELMRFELIAEEFGGDTLMVEVSALKGDNVATLLETLALQAEILELKADPTGPANGVVVESHIDTGRGAVATVLIQEGTLKRGEYFIAGTEYGRIRAMLDDTGQAITEAGPARPVEILGLSGAPSAGEQFVVVPDESEAREIAERRLARRKLRAAAAQPHVTLENLSAQVGEGGVKALNLIIKGDVQGSVEAIVGALRKIESDKVLLDILHSAAGGVTEGDVQLADASDAVILAFNVRPDAAARSLADQTGVEVKSYNIIYDLLEDIEAAMKGMLEPVYEEQEMSRVEVKQIFKISKLGNIAGCEVLEGTIGATHHARLVRNGAVIWRGKLASLRRHKDAAREVVTGMECGLSLENFNDIKVGDIVETYVLNEKEASLMSDKPAATESKSLETAGAAG